MNFLVNLLPNWVKSVFLQFFAALGLLNKEATIVLLGLDNAGKSTLLRRMTDGSFTSFSPTERPHVEEFQFGSVKFQAWDLGGHETVRYLWDDYMADSHGVVFMVDSADQERLDEAKTELLDLLGEPALQDAPVALLFNKQDLPAALGDEELRQILEWEEISQDRVIEAFPTSVLMETGINQALQWLASQL